MEREIMFKIYNTLLDSKNELDIKDIEIYPNLERVFCVKYSYKGNRYVICNDMIEGD